MTPARLALAALLILSLSGLALAVGAKAAGGVGGAIGGIFLITAIARDAANIIDS